MFPTRFPLVVALDEPAPEVSDSSLFGMNSWCGSSSGDSSSLSPSSFLVFPSCSYTSSSSPSDLSELAASFQSTLTIDIEAFGRDALGMQHQERLDPDVVRQDFVRNGIDSALAGRGVRRRPPGFTQEPVSCPKWPLNSLENVLQTSTPVEQPMAVTEAIGAGDRRPRRKHKENGDYCVFCYNNGEHQEVYMSHVCRDEQGNVECPRLRRYVCPYCKATDRQAHTKKYCPQKPIITPDDLLRMPPVGGSTLEVSLAAAVAVAGSKSKSKRSLRF